MSESLLEGRIVAWLAAACNPYPPPVVLPPRFHAALISFCVRGTS